MANRSRNYRDPLTVCPDVHSIENESKTSINTLENIRTPQKELKTQNSPASTEKWHTGVGNKGIDHLHRCTKHGGKQVFTDSNRVCGDSMDVAKGQSDRLKDRQMSQLQE